MYTHTPQVVLLRVARTRAHTHTRARRGRKEQEREREREREFVFFQPHATAKRSTITRGRIETSSSKDTKHNTTKKQSKNNCLFKRVVTQKEDIKFRVSFKKNTLIIPRYYY